MSIPGPSWQAFWAATGGTILLGAILLGGINWLQSTDNGIGPTVLSFFVLGAGVAAIAIAPAILTGLSWLALARVAPQASYFGVPLLAAVLCGGMARTASNMLAMRISDAAAGWTIAIAALCAWTFFVSLGGRLWAGR